MGVLLCVNLRSDMKMSQGIPLILILIISLHEILGQEEGQDERLKKVESLNKDMLEKLELSQLRIAQCLSQTQTDVANAFEDYKQKVDGLAKLPSQCHNYKSLTDSKRRYDFTDASAELLNYFCQQCRYFCDLNGKSYTSEDWDGPGWYRITGQAGTQLSENFSNWKRNHCGTYNSGHMLGGHPQPRQTVTREVCFRPDCSKLYENLQIEVTNCVGYYVYNLKEMAACHRRYCTQ